MPTPSTTSFQEDILRFVNCSTMTSNMADSNPPNVPTPIKSTRPVSEALLNEKVNIASVYIAEVHD